MDKRERINETVLQLPSNRLEPLKRFLFSCLRYYERANSETVRDSVLRREYDELCKGFCFLNDNGISLTVLRHVMSFSSMPWIVPGGATWNGFLQYLEEIKYRLELIPDPDETPTETLQDA